jgi:hypothetical protein
MLIYFPALLTNCGHTRCLSHVGTEGTMSFVAAKQPATPCDLTAFLVLNKFVM